MRLVGAHIVALPDYVQVIWTRKGAVPRDGSVLWSLYVDTPAGASRQLGYQLVDGHFGAQFVRDLGTGRRDDHKDDVAVEGDALVARFPLSALDGLGHDWTWRATLSIDGQDVSTVFARVVVSGVGRAAATSPRAG